MPRKRLPSSFSALSRLLRPFRRAEGDEEPQHRGRAVAFCLILSLLIWLTLTLRDTHVLSLALRTEIVGLPPGRALVTPPPPTVMVQVEGEGFSLIPLFSSNPTIPIAATSDEVNLETSLPRLPQNVRVRSITPRVLRLETGPLVTRTLPIVPNVALRFASTHALSGGVRLFPDSVTVTGAAGVLDGLAAWPTARREIDGVRDTLRVEVALLDTLGMLVTRSVDRTLFVAPVASFTGGEREVDVRVRGLPPNEQVVTLDPPSVRVRFRVMLGQYEAAMNAADFFATISYDEIRRDNTGRIRPQINLPEGIVLRDIEIVPPTVGYYTVLPGN